MFDGPDTMNVLKFGPRLSGLLKGQHRQDIGHQAGLQEPPAATTESYKDVA